MSKSRRNSSQCCVDEVKRLCRAHGYTPERLAYDAKVTKRTIERLLSGKRVDEQTIGLVARALGVDPAGIQMDTPVLTPASPTSTFNLRLAIDAVCTSPAQEAEIVRLGSDGASRLRMLGADVRSHREVLARTTDAVTNAAGPDDFILVGIAWRDGRQSKRGHRLLLIRADKYPAFIDAVVACTFTSGSLSAYGLALPDDLLAIRTIWDVVEAQPSSNFAIDDARLFTIVPMPQGWRYVTQAPGTVYLHTPEVLMACDRELGEASNRFDDEVIAQQQSPGTYTLALIDLKWRAFNRDFKATAVVSSANYSELIRSIRSLTLDLKDFGKFGRLIAYDSLDEGGHWGDPRRAPSLILSERVLDCDRVYVERIRFWDASNPFEHQKDTLTAASFM